MVHNIELEKKNENKRNIDSQSLVQDSPKKIKLEISPSSSPCKEDGEVEETYSQREVSSSSRITSHSKSYHSSSSSSSSSSKSHSHDSRSYRSSRDDRHISSSPSSRSSDRDRGYSRDSRDSRDNRDRGSSRDLYDRDRNRDTRDKSYDSGRDSKARGSDSNKERSSHHNDDREREREVKLDQDRKKEEINNNNNTTIDKSKQSDNIKPSIESPPPPPTTISKIIIEEDEETKAKRILEENRLQRQLILEKYTKEQQGTTTNIPPNNSNNIINITTAPIVKSLSNIEDNSNNTNEEDESVEIEWRKENSNGNEITSSIDENESCSSEEDLKKRGKIDQEDLKIKQPTIAVSAKPIPVKPEPIKAKPAAAPILDMFSDSPSDETDSTNIVDANVSTNPSINLSDNWDDADGYYKFKVGEIMDKYQIFSPIGSGVFSTVVSAKDVKTNEEVVIKIIRNRPSMNRSGLKEIEILQKINNTPTSSNQKSHCIQMKDHFTYRNHLCIVFEPMSMSLHQLIKKYGKNIGLSLNAVRVYAKQLFLALKHIKNSKIIHADIKPDNIVVNETKNTIKIVDFGSAGETHESEITPYLVSRFYRAPEIILGHKYDYAIDVWSVGCCLAELFTGKFLFPGKTNNDMIRLFLEYRGEFNKKMLKKSEFISNHFNENLVFMKQEIDNIEKTVRKVPFDITKPTKDILQFLLPKNVSVPDQDMKKLQQLKDLIEKCTILDPEKRITPEQAILHPFLKPN